MNYGPCFFVAYLTAVFHCINLIFLGKWTDLNLKRLFYSSFILMITVTHLQTLKGCNVLYTTHCYCYPES